MMSSTPHGWWQKWLTVVISGGQTGADLGALEGAKSKNIDTGGIAPKGWLTEIGPQEDLLRSFKLVESESSRLLVRTLENVRKGDVTILIGNITGGTRRTREFCRIEGKSCMPIPFPTDLPISSWVEILKKFLEARNPKTVNFAGNRESKNPGIQEFTRELVKGIFSYNHYPARDVYDNEIYGG